MIVEDKNPKSLENLYSFLKEYHLSDSLYNIGIINCCFKYGPTNIYLDDLPEGLASWISQLDFQQRLNLLLSATRLIRFLLLSGANDGNTKILRIESNELQIAMDMASKVYDKDVEKKVVTPLDRSKLLGRVSQWQFPLQEDTKALLGRGHLLFILIAKQYEAEYDVDAKMKSYFGLGAFEFMATGFSIWIKTSGTVDYQLSIEIPELSEVTTLESQRRFFELSSGTATDYKNLMRGKAGVPSKLNEIYGLDALMKMPAVRVDKSSHLELGEYVVPQPKYLYDRMSSGIFYLLAFKEQELANTREEKHSNPFRVAFGNMYREYVGAQLRYVKSSIELVDLDNDFTKPRNIKIPDFALIKDGICLLIEVKTSLLNIEARSYFEEQTLRKAVQEGSFSKGIIQLSKFKDSLLVGEIADDRFKNIHNVMTLILGYEDIYVINSSILPLISEYYGEMANGMQLGCISDIEAIGTYFSTKSNLLEVIQEKVTDEKTKYNSILGYLENIEKSRNPLLDWGAAQFFRCMGLSDDDI